MEIEQYAVAAMQALITSGLNSGAWEDYEDVARSSFKIAEAMKVVESELAQKKEEDRSKALDEALANPIMYP